MVKILCFQEFIAVSKQSRPLNFALQRLNLSCARGMRKTSTFVFFNARKRMLSEFSAFRDRTHMASYAHVHPPPPPPPPPSPHNNLNREDILISMDHCLERQCPLFYLLLSTFQSIVTFCSIS